MRQYRLLLAELEEVIREADAAADDLREVCGALLADGGSLRLVRMANLSGEVCSYELDLDELHRLGASASDSGCRLVGTFHSHVVSRAAPGESDIDGAVGELMLIIDTIEETARLWRIKDGDVQEEALQLMRSPGHRSSPPASP